MDIVSYLLNAVQRLGKCALLIRDLIRECRPTDLELALLKVRSGGIDVGLDGGGGGGYLDRNE